ncbi:MAG: hypothetical protein AB1898_33150 [Acidobacteriota bacterium]
MITSVLVDAIKLVIPAIVTFVFLRYVISRATSPGGSRRSQHVLEVILALQAAIIPIAVDSAITGVVRPSLEVSSQRSENAVEISIQNTGRVAAKIDDIVLSYPIPGRIKDFSAFDPTAGTQVEATALGGDSADWFQNQLQLRITVTAQRFATTCRVTFVPSPQQATLRSKDDDLTTNLDRYHLTYGWHGFGAEGRVEEWRLTANDASTEAPNVLVSGLQRIHGPSGPRPVPRRPL